jgi:fructokinase
MLDSGNLSLPIACTSKVQARIAVVGEIIWDIFQDSTCLGGAPLNFSVNCRRLGHSPLLLSAVGTDELGQRAVREIAALGLEVGQLQRSTQWKTGTASVKVDAQGLPTFHIDRPAAYDDLSLSDQHIGRLRQFDPSWLYFGTLFPSLHGPRVVLDQLMQALPRANRFYDVNLRSGFDSPDLIATLIAQADVVKLNETEAEVISRLFGLPSDLESFCRNGSERFGWKAVCITLGEQGCAILRGHEFCRAEGLPVRVADTVGAGDAFAAALLHGLVQQWPVVDIAQFANRVGALVASRTGAIPAWDLAEVTVRR